MTSAVVVGSGPNGLAAALTLAAAGVSVTVLEAADTVGGGTRSSTSVLPGLIVDECSGFHPLAVDNPFTRAFDLGGAGLRWLWPSVQYSHPLDGGRGAAAWQSVSRTAEGLGPDGAAWARTFGPLAERFDDITDDFLRPLLHIPAHPLKLARFGLAAGLPASLLARRFSSDEGRALFAGIAAHAFRPFGGPVSSAIGVALGTAAHRYGWPVAEGGSQAIADAVLTLFEKAGGRVETGVTVSSLAELGSPDIVMLDVAPAAAARIVGDAMPGRIRRPLLRYRHGPGSFKVDLAVEGGVPWQHEESRSAGTVHVGGTFADIAAAEKAVHAGRMPERPYVLVGQQYLADPSRSAGGTHPVYAYAHVPAGWAGDATQAIEGPDRAVRARVPGPRPSAARCGRSPGWWSTTRTTSGGDVVTGANDPLQLVFRPRVALDPYALGGAGRPFSARPPHPPGPARTACAAGTLRTPHWRG